MKKNIFLLAIIIFTCVTIKSFAQKNRTLSNGFSINLVTGFPSSTYGLTNDNKNADPYKIGSIGGLKIGNRWYFSPKEKYGFGLMVNWIDFSGAKKKGTYNSVNWERDVVDLSLLTLGPVGTYAISSNIALDAYYNLRPTGFGSRFISTSSSGSGSDETYTYYGLGMSNAIGVAFRYKLYNLGFESVFGGIKSHGTYSGPNNVKLESQKNMTNSFRILLGVKL